MSKPGMTYLGHGERSVDEESNLVVLCHRILADALVVLQCVDDSEQALLARQLPILTRSISARSKAAKSDDTAVDECNLSSISYTTFFG